VTATTTPSFTFTAGAGDAARLARARFRETRMRNLLAMALLAVLALALSVVAEEPMLVWLALAFVALDALVETLTFVAHLRVARRSIPAGTTLSVEYPPVVMRLTERDGETFLPYADLREARERGRHVALVRRAGPVLVLPAEACPPEAVAIVRAGIRSGFSPAVDEPQFPHRAQPDAAYARAVSRRTLAMLVTDPSAVGLALAIAVIGVGGSLLFASPVPAVFAVLMIVAWPIAALLSVRSALKRQIGSDTMYARFDADTFTTAHRGTVVRMPYTAFDELRESDGVVELRTAATRQRHLFPAALFPAEARERVRAATAAAASVPTP